MAETRKTRFRKHAVNARLAENWLAGGPVEVPAAPAFPEGFAELPVSAVFNTTSGDDPSTLLGYGTWSLLGDIDVGGNTVHVWERTA